MSMSTNAISSDARREAVVAAMEARINARSSLDESDDDDDDDDNLEEQDALTNSGNPGSTVGRCELAIVANDNSKKMMLAMCLGLMDEDGGKLAILDDEPYKSSKVSKRSFSYLRKDLLEEIARRSATSSKPPKCNNWPLKRLTDWLLDHPVTDSTDVLYLKAAEKSFRQLLVDANTEAQELENNARSVRGGNQWDHDTFLRVYHCIVDDRVKPLYLRRNEVLSRQALDARNNAGRPPTWTEAVAELYNDDTFEPHTLSLPDLHPDFADSKVLFYADMSCHITAEQVKTRLANCRAQVTKMISKWESSGNGDGNRARQLPDEAGYGHLDEEALANDDRAGFLGVNRSHILYFWHLCDVEQILTSTLAKLDESLVTDAENVPSAASRPRGKSKKDRDDDESNRRFQVGVSQSFATLSLSASTEQIMVLQDKILEASRAMALEEDPDLKRMYREQIKTRKQMLSSLRKQQAIHTTTVARTQAEENSEQDDDSEE